MLIGGVATYFIYRIKGTNEWFVVSRGDASDAGGGELSSLAAFEGDPLFDEALEWRK